MGFLDHPEIFACHTCDNRICTNPEHLFEGDIVVNNSDRHRKGRTPKKFSDDDIRYIRSSSMSYKELMEKFKISKVHLWRIKAHRTRKTT